MYLEKEQIFGTANYRSLPVVLQRGEGVFVWDISGNRYFDMTAGLGACAFGHAHPTLVKALSEQAATLSMCSRAFHNDQTARFLETLCVLTHMDKAMPFNSGAEAVEAMLKACRRFGYKVKGIPGDKAEVIVMDNNFHGRTLGMTSLSSSPLYRDGFGPFLPGIIYVPFNDIIALKQAITENTCAILTEPIQGEAGVKIPSPGWLKDVENVCKTHNILLAIDEVQSGMGRTGYMMAHEKDDVRADLVAFGKGLGGGLLPVSALVGRANVMSLFTLGSHGSTFGGNPLAMRIGYESLILASSLLESVRRLGIYFAKRLKDLPKLQDVRCSGLWAGLTLPKDIDAKEVSLALKNNSILAKNGSHNTIRLFPPLIMCQEELDLGLDSLERVLKTL